MDDTTALADRSCLTAGCTRPSRIRGLRQTCYPLALQDGTLARRTRHPARLVADGPTPVDLTRPGCKYVGCDRTVRKHQTCQRHLSIEHYGWSPCSSDGCPRFAETRGVCSACYVEPRRKGTFEKSRMRRFCTVDGCDLYRFQQGLCSMHFSRLSRRGSTGDPTTPPRRPCASTDCPNEVVYVERCKPCRRRFVKTGTGERVYPQFTSLDDRITASIEVGEAPTHAPELGRCFVWTGTVNPVIGYGAISVEGKSHYAHRVVYERAVGPIPAGLVLDHLCANKACVHPDHLEPVTRYENVRRGWALTGAVEEPPPTLASAKYWRLADYDLTPTQAARLPANMQERTITKASGCWLWAGPINKGTGYGTVSINKNRQAVAHRVAYMLAHGSIPFGHVLDHLCRNRACVNPEHLEPVTSRENVRRTFARPATGNHPSPPIRECVGDAPSLTAPLGTGAEGNDSAGDGHRTVERGAAR